MMDLALLRLVLDFGLLILIWMVQLVVYPSFSFYAKENLITWHHKYTQRITYIVMPLMLGQLGVASWQLLQVRSWYTLLSILLIALLWILTFWKFIPLHGKIAAATHDKGDLTTLVGQNWWRTLLWTLLFFLSLMATPIT